MSELEEMLENVMRESYGAGFYEAIVQVSEAIGPHLKGQQGFAIMHALTGLRPDSDKMVETVNASRKHMTNQQN